jgi:hypothetical protein
VTRYKVEQFFTRDNLVWTLTFLASVLAYLTAHTVLIPPAYAETVKDIASVLGFISGKLGWSPLASSDRMAQQGVSV